MANTITLSEVLSIENIVFLNYRGEEFSEHEFIEQMTENWHGGFFSIPVSNNAAYYFAVASASHKDHYGFDPTEIAECVEKFFRIDNPDYSVYEEEYFYLAEIL